MGKLDLVLRWSLSLTRQGGSGRKVDPVPDWEVWGDACFKRILLSQSGGVHLKSIIATIASAILDQLSHFSDAMAR